MSVTSEFIQECVRNIPMFDVRMELYRDVECMQLLRLSITSCGSNVERSERPKEIYEYKEFLFLKMYWSGDWVEQLFAQVQRGETIEIKGLDAIVKFPLVDAIQFQVNRVFSGQSYGLRKRQNPFDLYETTENVDNLPNANPKYYASQLLNREKLLYFPTLQEAEGYYLFDVFLEARTPSRSRIQVAIDDKRARFERIIVSSGGLKASLTGTELINCELKLFGKRPGLADVFSVPSEGEVEIPLEAMPAELSVFVTCGNEVIDQRYISDHPSIYAPSEGVIVERDEQTSIEGILMIRGENQYTEFKQDYTDKILSTICAFANADGGSIYIGITDDGEIQGIKEPWDIIRLRIESTLTDRMLGHVKVNYFPHSITLQEDKVILEVKVFEADEKPVAIRNKEREDYYLRRDGTNRKMKRDDWAHLIRTQSPVQVIQKWQDGFLR